MPPRTGSQMPIGCELRKSQQPRAIWIGKFVEATAKEGGLHHTIFEQKPSPQEPRRTHERLAHHGAASARDGGTHGRPAGGPREMDHQSGLSERGSEMSFGS
jgi:hypothetical protein